MPYKISGTLNKNARIIVLKESDWSIESNSEETYGDYSIESLVTGDKTVIGITSVGDVRVFGAVVSEEYA